jgi:hypothetical protein
MVGRVVDNILQTSCNLRPRLNPRTATAWVKISLQISNGIALGFMIALENIKVVEVDEPRVSFGELGRADLVDCNMEWNGQVCKCWRLRRQVER